MKKLVDFYASPFDEDHKDWLEEEKENINYDSSEAK